MQSSKRSSLLLVIMLLIFVGITFAMRLLPHPANFIPMGALALFSGVYLRSKWGMLVPVLVMVSTDLIIGWHNLVLFTWGCFVLMAAIGWWVRRQGSWSRIIGGSLAGSVIFYLVTNFAVWAFTPLYAKTVAGLVQSYVMAVPFFRSTVLGDLFYVSVFFGTYQAVAYLAAHRRRAVIAPVRVR